MVSQGPALFDDLGRPTQFAVISGLAPGYTQQERAEVKAAALQQVEAVARAQEQQTLQFTRAVGQGIAAGTVPAGTQWDVGGSAYSAANIRAPGLDFPGPVLGVRILGPSPAPYIPSAPRSEQVQLASPAAPATLGGLLFPMGRRRRRRWAEDLDELVEGT